MIAFAEYLLNEWVPALGCTEPASIALAAATAAAQVAGPARSVRLIVDSKIYKNCYAVGIPHSGHKTGIRWAAALGANLSGAPQDLECFRAIAPETIARAQKLIDAGAVAVEVDPEKDELFIDCRVARAGGSGRTVIECDHTNIVLIEKDGATVKKQSGAARSGKGELRRLIARIPHGEMIDMARGIGAAERKRLREGIALNRRIAEHGLALFPRRFVDLAAADPLTRISTHVCAGVYARMWGEDFPVMSLAGSGNKGIVASVPLAMWGEHRGIASGLVEEALALACLFTTAATHHLGTLSAVCGCSNAAGIGLAAGLVLMEGGGAKEIGLAINNMVGNVTGMICDGAKIGCALKTMTAADAAFRSAALALSGIGIPPSDGIVGAAGQASLENLGRIATRGMTSMDGEILAIMQEKLK